MPEKINRNLVSPARELSQRLNESWMQQDATKYRVPQEIGRQDAANALRYAGPKPTIYNVNTGEWEETNPTQARLLNVPIGPPSQSILDRMWRDSGSQPYWHGGGLGVDLPIA